ncbi:hypothetical protein, partial [Streptococcus anginosus]|uniref:hypothetical protein n=1 Tax=Streptococcus anginosus TaxID=1328 RepID=UPI002ED9F885
MNANGLALNVDQSQAVDVQLQDGSETTSFIVLRYQEYYQFVDPQTGLYLAVSQDNAAVLELVPNSKNAQALWNIV